LNQRAVCFLTKRKGIATKVLAELEIRSTELSYEKHILETPKNNLKQSDFTKRMDTNFFQTTDSMLKSKTACGVKRASNNNAIDSLKGRHVLQKYFLDPRSLIIETLS
jgi:hypothetical protein